MDEEYDYDTEDEEVEEPEDEAVDEADVEESGEGDFQSVIIDASEAKRRMNTIVKKSVNILTKFEKARILGMRIRQLQMGAPPLIDTTSMHSERQIADKELEMRRCPLIVRRYITRQDFEDWRLTDFIMI